MSHDLFHDDAYLQDAQGVVAGHTGEGGVILKASVFYPAGGGQPGDSGRLEWEDAGVARSMSIATTIKTPEGDTVLIPAEPVGLPPVGKPLIQRLDWGRRHRHMRVHTALHLLSVVCPLPVIGGSMGSEKGRLDFRADTLPTDMQSVEIALNELIERDLTVSEHWITVGELQNDPSMTQYICDMSPSVQGRARLIRIGRAHEQVDLQPCVGTHVARTSEIGRIRIGSVEKQGRHTCRIALHLD